MNSIILRDHEVRALLDTGRVQVWRPITSVRRIGPVTEFQRSDTPGYDFIMRDREMRWNDLREADLLTRGPYQPGQVVAVREAWTCGIPFCPSGTSFRADHVDPRGDGPANPMKWRSASQMPLWAARYRATVAEVQARQVQDAELSDVLEMGIKPTGKEEWVGGFPCTEGVYDFAKVWDRHNPKHPWKSNPWCWTYTLKMEKPNAE